MDESVIASMARWPDVPYVYGWMSLSEQGQWRLHPNGDAWQANQPCQPPFAQGEPIENAQIRRFIDRNYLSSEHGNWYFQNGPQRVYVRLDAAPYILRTQNTPLSFHTHNDLPVKKVENWWLDDEGRLYAETEHGPGLVSGRDLAAAVDALCTCDGTALITALDSLDIAALQPVAPPGRTPRGSKRAPLPALEVQAQMSLQASSVVGPAMLYFCPTHLIADYLGFVRCPV